MANDGRTQFIEGLRVTSDHLNHMQVQLRDAVRDLRRTVGLGRVAWGLRVSLGESVVLLQPGVAFSAGGVRLNIDAPANLNIPPGSGPWRVVLRAAESDRESLRVGGQPTLINLITTASVEPDDGSEIGADALVIAKVKLVNAKPELSLDPGLYAAAGHHTHSGEFFQDEFGHWHYDGPKLAGAAGTTGLKGDVGPEGPPGSPGAPGLDGEKGDRGDRGEPGESGSKGDKGDKGDPGVAGTKGDKGDKGEPGTPGAKGDPGAASAKGDKGEKGDPGAKGDKGDRGDPGAKGEPGTPGAKGDKGDPGTNGLKGDKGDPGTPGAKGDAGTPGAKGDKGDPGAPGAKGEAGVQGSPGVGLERDWPFIQDLNWRHGATLSAVEALGGLTSQSGLTIALSHTLAQTTLTQQPQIIEVWFEADLRAQLPVLVAPISAPSPGPIFVLHGASKFDSQGRAITWFASDHPQHLQRTIFPGGKILIRVHCGHIFDKDGRPFSSALDVVTGVKTLHVPGAVFESWFFVKGAG